MGLAKKDGALLLAVVAAVCIQLYQGKISAGPCADHDQSAKLARLTVPVLLQLSMWWDGVGVMRKCG